MRCGIFIKLISRDSSCGDRGLGSVSQECASPAVSLNTAMLFPSLNFWSIGRGCPCRGVLSLCQNTENKNQICVFQIQIAISKTNYFPLLCPVVPRQCQGLDSKSVAVCQKVNGKKWERRTRPMVCFLIIMENIEA